MWEEVITCYNYLKLRHKAAEIIREQMKNGETVKLWCSLGDATDDVMCYERAWELSQHKSSQAQRHWRHWQLYADLTSSIEEQTPVTRSKAVQYYQKAYTAAIQDNGWFKEIKSMHKILNICECLAEAHFAFAKECPSTNEAIHSLSSAKLSLQNIIAKITQHLSEFNVETIDDQFNKDLASLQTTLESVKKELTNLKNSI